MKLSKRANALISAPSSIITGHSLCASSPYSLENSDGYLNFGTAENHLVSELLLPRLNSKNYHNESHIQYNALHGLESFRKDVSSFFESFIGLKNINPDNIIVQCGVSAICEALSFSLFDEGDIILIPAPYYTGFDHDFTKRFKVKFKHVYLDQEGGFKHHIKYFKKAFEEIEDKSKVKAILITDPHNPTGEILSQQFHSDIIDFCKENNLSLISDEIYTLSDYTNLRNNSLYQKAVDANIDAHFLYGMAKDFALAGLKVGFYTSNNDELNNAMRELSYFHPVSTCVQLIVSKFLSDHNFVKNFSIENQKRLRPIEFLIRSQLSMFSFNPPQAGLFMILDLSEYIESFEKETRIFETLLHKYKINISPGQSMSFKEPGYFRVCFAQKKENILEFITRMKNFYETELN